MDPFDDWEPPVLASMGRQVAIVAAALGASAVAGFLVTLAVARHYLWRTP